MGVGVLFQLSGFVVGVPGLLLTSEYSKSISGVSEDNLGVVQLDCCGGCPVLVNTLVDIYRGAVPTGIPSLHTGVDVGMGDSQEPPVGIDGVSSLLINTIDLKEAIPSSPGSPSLLYLAHRAGSEYSPQIPSCFLRMHTHS